MKREIYSRKLERIFDYSPLGLHPFATQYFYYRDLYSRRRTSMQVLEALAAGRLPQELVIQVMEHVIAE